MRWITLVLAFAISCGGESQTLQTDIHDALENVPADVGDQHPAGWGEATHSKKAIPDYDTVFPQDSVLRIEVTVAPEDWQAMLADMTELYGDFGKSGDQQQQVPTEAVEACDGVEDGGACTVELPGKTISGTCEELWDGLVACKDAGASTDPPGESACTDKAVQDDCEFQAGPGLLAGICLQAPGKLVCVPAKDVETCLQLEVGDPCALGPPDNPIDGTCTDYSGTVACIPEGKTPGGGGGPGGAPPGGGGIDRDPIWVPVTVQANGLTWWFVGMRFKGNSTLKFTWQEGSYKLPFKFDFDQFEDDHPEIDDQRFYGFKRLAFANNQRDDSCLREKLAGEFFRASGIPTPQRAFVQVTIDYGDGPRIMGLYTMAEVPDKPLFQTFFDDDAGNLYKPEGVHARWGEGAIFDDSSFPKKTNEEEADWGDIEAAVAALHGDQAVAEAWRTALEERLDVDGFLKYLAANTVMQDWDQYGNIPHNYYLYGDLAHGGRIHWIPWDHNESLKASGGMMPPLPLDMASVDQGWPLIRLLMDDALYLAQYQGHVADFVAGPFQQEIAQSRINAAHVLIAPYVTGDEGETEPFTVLSSKEAFVTARDEILEHVETRHQAVADYLHQ